MRLLYDFAVCSMAALFFALLFHTPKRAVIVSAVMGGVGYVIYDMCCAWLSPVFGYFFGTLFISVSAEILARLRKMPALIFQTPAVIPLVPGVGIYQTMRFFVNGDSSAGVEKCIETLSFAGAMAVAIALPPMIITVFTVRRQQKTR